jgi:pyridoxine 4-dehydrogenase
MGHEVPQPVDGIAFSPSHPVTLTEGPDTARVESVVETIAARHGVGPRQLALAWHLHHSPVSLPIPGTTSITHLRDNLAAAQIILSADEVAELTSLAPETSAA